MLIAMAIDEKKA